MLYSASFGKQGTVSHYNCSHADNCVKYDKKMFPFNKMHQSFAIMENKLPLIGVTIVFKTSQEVMKMGNNVGLIIII